MSMTDRLADMLTRIRNAEMRRKESVDIPATNLHEAVARILVQEGYVHECRRIDEGVQGIIRLVLKYGRDRQGAIVGIQRVSKPGRRIYARKDDLPRPLSGLGIAIMSTSQGVMTATECRKRGIGGEVLCHVW
jgi:small subunit ribosomal protein S8